MKDALKYFGLVLAGLFVAVVLYPLLHEAGHSATTLLMGGKVVEFRLLPLPYVICEVSDVGIPGRVLIGTSGVAIPYILFMLPAPKNFWIWYVSFLTKGISVYSVFLSLVFTFVHIGGYSFLAEDIVQVICMSPDTTAFLVIALCIMGVCGIIKIKSEKPVLRCVDYFQIRKDSGFR